MKAKKFKKVVEQDITPLICSLITGFISLLLYFFAYNMLKFTDISTNKLFLGLLTNISFGGIFFLCTIFLIWVYFFLKEVTYVEVKD